MKTKRKKTKRAPFCEGALDSQIEQNENLKAFHGQTIKNMEFVTLKGGVLPDGMPYEGEGLIVEAGTAHDVKLLLVPIEGSLRFYIGTCEHIHTEPDREKMAMHAADHLERECRRHGSHASRFRNESSSVYVALNLEAQEAFDALYESRFEKKVIQ